MDEFTLFEEIKNAFTIEKGRVLMLEITSGHVAEYVPEVFDNLKDSEKRASFYIAQKKPYAVFNYLSYSEIVYLFVGKTFTKEQIVSTGEIIDFSVESDEPVSTEDVRRDLSKLNLILHDPKAC